MNRLLTRRIQIQRIRYQPHTPGNRAVFMVEVRSKTEARQLTELFTSIARIARVVPLSQGAVIAYAVEVKPGSPLLGKIEWLLKTRFYFSVTERGTSDVSLHLVKTLCDDTDSEMFKLPTCGVCGVTDPFPQHLSLLDSTGQEACEAAYCGKCCSLLAEVDPARAARALVRKDRRRFEITARTPVECAHADSLPTVEAEEWPAEELAIAV